MRFPQVGDRVKEAPAHALRAMFAGIGQMLLVADRMRNRPADPETGQPAGAESPTRANQAAAGQLRFPLLPAASNDGSRWRSLDETGNVRILPVEYQASQPVAPAAAQAERTGPVPAKLALADPGTTGPVATGPVPAELALADPGTTGPVATGPVATGPVPAELALAEPPPAESARPGIPGPVELPVPNYDSLSLASLRARLRNLDSAQILLLLGYEKANAARPAVLAMYERRVSKLRAGQG
jgi:hypothetical protein